MFVWNEEMIRFLRDAAEYGRFYETLAERAAGAIAVHGHVCDAGCGLGYLSCALAKDFLRVTAVDTSPEALAVLRETAARGGCRNVTAAEADVFSYRPETPYDGMVFCFFGSVPETLDVVCRCCAGTAVLFKKNWATHRFTVRERPLERFTYAASCDALDALCVPYETETFSLDMGQPFRSLADAAAFFQLHDRDAGPVLPDEVRGRLQTTGSDAFPYYLPADRPLGMIVLNTGAVRARLKKELP